MLKNGLKVMQWLGLVLLLIHPGFLEGQVGQLQVSEVLFETKNEGEVYLKLGEKAFFTRDYEAARSYLKKAVKMEEGDAHYYLSLMYLGGKGVHQSAKKAFNHAVKGYALGSPAAGYQLAHFYYNGTWVKVSEENGDKVLNDVEAGAWFLEAYQKYQWAEHAYVLGFLYDFGLGKVEEDLTKAREWYSLGAVKGHPCSQNSLAMNLAEGEGGPQDLDQAIYWFRESAHNGCLDAQANLGYVYEHGLGVERDQEVAMHWLELAADAGHERAAYLLDIWYYNPETFTLGEFLMNEQEKKRDKKKSAEPDFSVKEGALSFE